MTTFSPLVATVAAALLLFALGCSAEKTADLELPTVEPKSADRPDAQILDSYLASRTKVDGSAAIPAIWPQLFGAERTSFVSSPQLNLSWPETGPQELWSVPCGSGYGSPVTTLSHVVFNHRIEDEEIVQCVTADTGSTLWEHRYPTTFKCDYEYSSGPLSTPTIHGNRVYCVGGQGQFFCLDLESGDIMWSRMLHDEYSLEDDLFAVGSTPAVIDGKVIFNLGAVEQGAGILAMDADTGETAWTATDHGMAYCSPFSATLHGEPFVFVITGIGLVSLDPRTGEVDWSIEHRGRAPMSFNAVSPMVHGNHVIAVTGPGPGAVCVEVQPDRSYIEAWRDRRVIDSQYNSLMCADGRLYGFTAAGQGGAELRSVDVATGELKWRYHSILRRGQALMADDVIIVLGELGHLASILRRDDRAEVLAFTGEPLMQEPCYCSPALSGSRLYLKDETRVACFDLSEHP